MSIFNVNHGEINAANACTKHRFGGKEQLGRGGGGWGVTVNDVTLMKFNRL